MGVARAPVAGSGWAPAWMARVSNAGVVSLMFVLTRESPRSLIAVLKNKQSFAEQNTCHDPTIRNAVPISGMTETVPSFVSS